MISNNETVSLAELNSVCSCRLTMTRGTKVIYTLWQPRNSGEEQDSHLLNWFMAFCRSFMPA